VSTGALGLALGAALVHALWNVLLAREEDVEAATPVALACGVVLLAPFALLDWRVEAGAWPYIAASIAFELAYFALLARAYAREEVGFVYPVARGAGPVFVLIASVLLLGDSVGLAAAAGVVAISAGVLLVRPPSNEPGRADVHSVSEVGPIGGGEGANAEVGRVDVHSVSEVGPLRWQRWGMPLGVAVAIAGYTLVDDRGVEHANALPYLLLVLAPVAVVQVAAVRGRARDAVSGGAVFAGLGMVGAYGLTLAALDRAQAGPVAAVRETSVVIAVVLASVLIGERISPKRLAGAVLVAAGVAVLGLR
jgi:drug/metabolite transporter (DMT)-like permease